LANFSGWFCRNYPGPDTIIHKPEWHAPKVFRAAADAIARYARHTLQPVPVAERMPGPEDCDKQGRCWWYLQRNVVDDPGLPNWTLDTYRANPRHWLQTHWLPAHALPVPQREAG
jgi:hypothetical protein